jgi:hypothetical protein
MGSGYEPLPIQHTFPWVPGTNRGLYPDSRRPRRGRAPTPPAQAPRTPQRTPPATARPGPAHVAAPAAACVRPAPYSPAPNSMGRTCEHKAEHAGPPVVEPPPERRKQEPRPPPSRRHPRAPTRARPPPPATPLPHVHIHHSSHPLKFMRNGLVGMSVY